MANPFVLDTNCASLHGLYNTYNTKEHTIGSMGVIGDRQFRYVKFMDSTAIGPNKLAAQAAPVANHVTQTVTLAGSGFDVIGSTVITLVSIGATAVQENEYADGYVKVQSATLGTGQMYKVKGNKYTAASGTLVLTLYDPVQVAVTGTLIVSMIHNPWSHVVISPTTAVAASAGVTMINFPAATTASVATNLYLQTGTATWTLPQYGWIQTKGAVSVLLDTSTTVAGSDLNPSTTTAGCVMVDAAAGIVTRIGVAMEALAGGSKYVSAHLRID